MVLCTIVPLTYIIGSGCVRVKMQGLTGIQTNRHLLIAIYKCMRVIVQD